MMGNKYNVTRFLKDYAGWCLISLRVTRMSVYRDPNKVDYAKVLEDKQGCIYQLPRQGDA